MLIAPRLLPNLRQSEISADIAKRSVEAKDQVTLPTGSEVLHEDVLRLRSISSAASNSTSVNVGDRGLFYAGKIVMRVCYFSETWQTLGQQT
jgi:hypothetical protein